MSGFLPDRISGESAQATWCPGNPRRAQKICGPNCEAGAITARRCPGCGALELLAP